MQRKLGGRQIGATFDFPTVPLGRVVDVANTQADDFACRQLSISI
jgi:hypothetical protein